MYGLVYNEVIIDIGDFDEMEMEIANSVEKQFEEQVNRDQKY